MADALLRAAQDLADGGDGVCAAPSVGDVPDDWLSASTHSRIWGYGSAFTVPADSTSATASTQTAPASYQLGTSTIGVSEVRYVLHRPGAGK